MSENRCYIELCRDSKFNYRAIELMTDRVSNGYWRYDTVVVGYERMDEANPLFVTFKKVFRADIR